MSSGVESIHTDTESSDTPRRLCSEIQLFDLCELERCHFKDGRFCTDTTLLTRFEAVAEPQDRPVPRFDDDEEEQQPEEFEDDDDGYSVFDDEDRQEQSEEW